MTSPYTPPGVSVREISTPASPTPLLAAPETLCLIGLSAGSVQRTDPIILNGTVPTVLPGVPAGSTMTSTAISKILDATNPSIAPNGYSSTTDYTFSSSNYTIARQVTANTLSGLVSIGATSATLASGSVPAVGQVISLGNTTTTVTGNTTVGSNTITNLSATGGLAIGQTLAASGVPGGTLITNIDVPHSTLTLSDQAFLTATAVSCSAALIELATVAGVVGQVVTISAPARSAHATASAVTWGTIPDGNTVYVTYNYAPSDYFQPVRLTNMSDVQNRFGNAWDPTGTFINSSLSYAALNAFSSGASQVVLQPFYVLNSGVPTQPTASQFADPAQWSVVLAGLRDLEGINAIVPVIGQSMANVTDSVQIGVFSAVQDYLQYQNFSNDSFTIAFFGEDSSASSSVAQEATIIGHGQTLTSRYGGAVTQQMVLVNTSNFSQPNQIGQFSVGGQYLAASLAGMLVSRSVSSTLTRQVVPGFSNVTDPRTKAQKNNDAGNNLLVVENKGNVVQVRHAITLDSTSVATNELSIVNSKFNVINSVALTLNTQIIGQVAVSQDAPTLINNVVIGTLEALRGARDIGGYANVQTANISLNPTVYAVSFSFQPLFPIDYINVSFSLDLTAAVTTITSSSSGA